MRYLREAVGGRPADQRNSTRKREPGLRDIYSGFDLANGFDLRHPERWTRAMHDRVQDAAKVLRHLLSSPYAVKKPRNAQERKTLRYFTEQTIPNQKRFIVHTATADARVRLVREKGKKQLTLQVRRPQRFGGFGEMRYWLFKEYLGYAPQEPDDFIEATQRMLPDMPDWGYFSLWSQPNGVITIPQPKKSLLKVLARFFQEGESFGGDKLQNALDILQGWVLQGNEADAERVYIARQKRRASKPNRFRGLAASTRRRMLKIPKRAKATRKK